MRVSEPPASRFAHHDKLKLDGPIAKRRARFVGFLLQDDLPHAYYERGYAYSKLNQSKAAIADYTAAIRLKPDYAAAYCDRGAARIAVGDNKGTIQDTTKALKLDPNWICAHYTRGVAYYQEGNDTQRCPLLSAEARDCIGVVDCFAVVYAEGNPHR